ncbi:efflux transporter outer membrane subunit [Saccharibacter sp. 17.LH.SD]|uniref:efflux transporter outer membrane subunit n=1 Tax=Saccharibacter sp. 17.LH.SD TaxID=2689393 RepID=UPI00136E9165|nr:efflux transporter outer membrane subunit [Saccharibacter sp. 17.LH.SD]MXV45199.1 efflux transporter outer membrane subunit [Saccharibacter sp. 17.LH.SD]
MVYALSSSSKLFSRLNGVAVSLLLGSLGGCMVGPKDKAPALPKHADYNATPFTQTSGRNTGNSILRKQFFVNGMDVSGQWWEVFQNPKLNRLVEEALANNQSLKAMQAGLKASWEQRRVEGAALYPSISAQFIPSRNKTSKTLSPVPNSNEWLYNLHTAQLNIGYVPDLWGGTRNAIKAASAQADIQQAQLEATALTMISNLVNATIIEAGVRAQIHAKEAQIAEQRQVLAIQKKQNGLGDLSRQSTLIQRDALAQIEADLPPLKNQLAQTRDQIAVLVGVPPNEDLPIFELKDFTLPEKLPVSLPSALLEHRPDIQAARAQIKAAAAQVGIAIANRLPNVQLSALPGQAVGHMSEFFKPGYGNWEIAATVTQPIFQGGSLLHAQREARDNLLQANEYYKSTVISAIGDVADSLHAVQFDSDTLMADQNGLDAAEASLRIAQAQHRFGDNSQIDLIQARLSVIQDQLSVAQDETARFSDTVGLFQSLGGGWWHRDDLGVSPQKAKYLSNTLVPW